MKKSPLAGGLLVACVVAWGIWAGGQLFSSVMMVPMFTESAGALQAYFQLPRQRPVNFLLVFGPLVVTMGIAGPMAAWKTTTKARKWLLGSLICAVIVAVSFYFAVQSIGTLIDRGLAGTQSPETITAGLARWKLAKNARLIVELAGFFASVMALRRWAEE